jgi:hypothetical protein
MPSAVWSPALLLLALPSLLHAQVSFRPQTEYPVTLARCCSLLSADFRHTGHVDLVVGSAALILFDTDNGTSTPLYFLANRGDGTFNTKPITVPLPIDLNLVAAADLNGDDNLDLVALVGGGYSKLRSVYLPGNGDGTFRAPVDLGPDMVVAVADVNGDGKPDLIDAPVFQARLNRGDGTFDPPAYNGFPICSPSRPYPVCMECQIPVPTSEPPP